MRQGFRRILEDEPGITVVGEGGSGARGRGAGPRRSKPDVVVLDMSMPDMNGIHAARMILRERPQTRVLILSMYSDEQYVRSALDAGVAGYILKSALETDLTRAVRAVAAGQQYLSPELSAIVHSRAAGQGARPTILGSADRAREAGAAAHRARQVEQGDRGRAQPRASTPSPCIAPT